jgi:hypothetical protein
VQRADADLTEHSGNAKQHVSHAEDRNLGIDAEFQMLKAFGLWREFALGINDP